MVIASSIFLKYHPTNNDTFTNLFPNNAMITTTQPQATIKGHKITLLLAKTDKEKFQGLSERNTLAENTGMLFVFQRAGYYQFWMRHVKFPLDILYITGNTIVATKKNVQNPDYTNQHPPIIKASVPANKILELPAGFSKKYHILVGDTITFSDTTL